MVVEEVCNKCKIELLVAVDHVLGGDEGPAVNPLSLGQHDLCSFQPVLPGERLLVKLLIAWRHLSQQLSVDLAVLDVLAEVLDESGAASLGRIVIRIFRNI